MTVSNLRTLTPEQIEQAKAVRVAEEARIRDEADAKGFERGRSERFAEVEGVYEKRIAADAVKAKESDRKAEAHGYWRGSAIFGIISLLFGFAGGIWSASTMMLNTGAVVDQATRPEWRPPELRALDEDSQPVDELPGYARPGREPASAPR